jgi:hypothetical protein
VNIEIGLSALENAAQGTEWYSDFILYEAQMRELLKSEQRYGPSEQTRRDWSRIIESLNGIALKHLDVSFNQLCEGKYPVTPAGQIKIVLSYPEEELKYEAIVSPRFTVDRLLRMVVKKLNLAKDLEGGRIIYELAFQKEQTILLLSSTRTLAEYGIKDRDILVIQKKGG